MRGLTNESMDLLGEGRAKFFTGSRFLELGYNELPTNEFALKSFTTMLTSSVITSIHLQREFSFASIYYL